MTQSERDALLKAYRSANPVFTGDVKGVPMVYGTGGEIPDNGLSFEELWDTENMPNGNLFPADGSNNSYK
jgi:hypothetical protein